MLDNSVPKPLAPGDKIAIVSPASVVNPDYIDGAAAFFRAEGFEPVVMPHAKGPSCGSFAAPDSERLEDLVNAYRDPSIRAVLCARGGYGCNRLLPLLPPRLMIDNSKWLIGFSDISALHAFNYVPRDLSAAKSGDFNFFHGALHSPMAKHLSTLSADHYCTRALMRILTEGLPVKYEVPSHPLAGFGEAEGTLIGGNLAVINGLADTPYDPLRVPGPKILFIEDVSEAIYAVERMLIRLKLSGRLEEVTGIIAGQFTEYRPDRNFETMEEMIVRTLSSGSSLPNRPLALGFPAGHTEDNLPLPLGARARLTVTSSVTTLALG